jgi:hypothetical protein
MIAAVGIGGKGRRVGVQKGETGLDRFRAKVRYMKLGGHESKTGRNGKTTRQSM